MFTAVLAAVLEWALPALQAIAAILFGALTWSAMAGLRRLRALPTERSPSPPSVSVVVPARNEADRIAGTLRRLLAQQHVDLQVIAVDDDSSDATATALAAAAQDPRVTALTLRELPPGWLGKCHALHRGSAAARGDWLLFSDADAWLGADVIARAVCVAQARGLAHLTLMPALADVSQLGRIAVLGFAIPGLRHIALLGRSRSAYLGFGAFNLVRQDAYRTIGGHESLRQAVIDDMQLGRALQRRGYRTGVFFSRDVEVRWVTDLAAHFRLLEKNAFAVFDFSTAKTTLAAGGALTLHAIALLGAVSGQLLGSIAGGCLLSQALPGALMARRYGWSPWLGLGVPLLAQPLQAATVLWSMLTTLRRGGITWRGRHHALTELRAAARALRRT